MGARCAPTPPVGFRASRSGRRPSQTHVLGEITLSLSQSGHRFPPPITLNQTPNGSRPATKVGRNAEGNSRIEKLAEGTDQAGDNEAAQEQVQVGEN